MKFNLFLIIFFCYFFLDCEVGGLSLINFVNLADCKLVKRYVVFIFKWRNQSLARRGLSVLLIEMLKDLKVPA